MNNIQVSNLEKLELIDAFVKLGELSFQSGLIDYVAYGSNMLSTRLIDRVGPIVNITAQTLEIPGYTFRYNKPSYSGECSYGNLVKAPGFKAWGVCYPLTIHQMATLIGYESGYNLCVLMLEGFPKLTFMYDQPYSFKPPTRAYEKLILQGAEENNLNPYYIKRYLKWG